MPWWHYTGFKGRIAPDPQSRTVPRWIAEAEIVACGREARRHADSWLSIVSPSALPHTYAAIQAVGEARIAERVAVAWLLKEAFRLPESLRELLPVIGSDWPELDAVELVDAAAVVLWSRLRALPVERRPELRDTFRVWGDDFASVAASAWKEWEAYLYPEGRRAPGGAL